MDNVLINGREVPIGQILEVYEETEGRRRWMVVVWGESAVEIDPFTADDIMELAPHLVDDSIKRTRQLAYDLQNSWDDD